MQEGHVPGDQCCTKEYGQEGGGAEEGAEGKLVVGALAFDCDDGDTDDAAEDGAGKDGQYGALEAEECAGHEHHFDVTEAHAFAAAEAEVTFRDDPENAGADKGADEGVEERENPVRRWEGEEAIGEESGGAVIHGDKEAEDEAEGEAGEIYFVGKDALAEVGEDEDDDERGEDGPLESGEGEAEGEVAGEEEESGERFDDGVYRRDARAALAAFAAENQVAEDGNVVVGADGGGAVSAGGGGKDDGFTGRQTNDHDVEEAA